MDKDKLLSFLDDLAYDLKAVLANASQAKRDAFKFDDLKDALDGLDSVMDSVGAIRESVLRLKEDTEYKAISAAIALKEGMK